MPFARPPGRLEISVKETESHLKVVITDDGIGMSDAGRRSGFGSRMIKTLARQLQAEVVWTVGDPGTVVELRLPIHPAAQVGQDG